MGNKKYQDKRMNIIVNKIGLSEEVAEWCVSKSKKYSIWIANQLLHIPIQAHSLILNKKQDFVLFDNQIDNILDWKKEVQGINLNDYTFKKAVVEADKFHKSLFVPNNNGLKNTNVVLDCGDYKWVQLVTIQDCKEEGSTMGHCIGNSSHNTRISSGDSIAFSLRDKFNRPHLTIEALSKNKKVFEFKGHSNSAPKSEYLDYFVQLNEKYNFSTITDSTIRAFEENVNAVEKLSEFNTNFFTFDFKIRLGLLPFSEGESYLDIINIVSEKDVIIPDNVSIYNSININSKSISLGDNLLVGGSLSLNTNKKSLKVGENVSVGGNLIVDKKVANTKEIENINYFGIFSVIFD